MIVIALLVPVALLLLMFALDAWENFLFPGPPPNWPDAEIPEQLTPDPPTHG
ncbi:hypothetical protein ABZ858_24805 [Streptomyces sp. NPDC047017]|uniref:hypothetical protein n=1 Tax=Streptomyces sp. NPDC047017 TaxID=3155024 RepID=UPI0033EB0458